MTESASVPVQIAHLSLEFQRGMFALISERAQVQAELQQLKLDNAQHERTIRALQEKVAALQSQLALMTTTIANNNKNITSFNASSSTAAVATPKETAVAVLRSFTARTAEEVSVELGDLVFLDAVQPFRDWTAVSSRHLGRGGFVPTAVLQQSGEMSRCVAKATVKVAFNGRDAQTADRPPLLTAAVDDRIHVFAPSSAQPVWLEAISVTRHKYGYIPAACVALDDVSLEKLSQQANAANAANAANTANTSNTSNAANTATASTTAVTNTAAAAAPTAVTTARAGNVAYPAMPVPFNTTTVTKNSNGVTSVTLKRLPANSTPALPTTTVPPTATVVPLPVPPPVPPPPIPPTTALAHSVAPPTLAVGAPVAAPPSRLLNVPRTRPVTPPPPPTTTTTTTTLDASAPPPLRLVEHASTSSTAATAAVPVQVAATTTANTTTTATTAPTTTPAVAEAATAATPAATSVPPVSASISVAQAPLSTAPVAAVAVPAATPAVLAVVADVSSPTSDDSRRARSASNGLAATKRGNGDISTATAATSSRSAAAAEPVTSSSPRSPNRASPASKRARTEREPSAGGAETRGNTSSAVSEEKPEGTTTANDQIYRARKQAMQAARAAVRRADWASRTRNDLDEALKPTHAVDFEDLTRNPL